MRGPVRQFARGELAKRTRVRCNNDPNTGGRLSPGSPTSAGGRTSSRSAGTTRTCSRRPPLCRAVFTTRWLCRASHCSNAFCRACSHGRFPSFAFAHDWLGFGAAGPPHLFVAEGEPSAYRVQYALRIWNAPAKSLTGAPASANIVETSPAHDAVGGRRVAGSGCLLLFRNVSANAPFVGLG